jgi:hypothetical protein
MRPTAVGGSQTILNEHQAGKDFAILIAEVEGGKKQQSMKDKELKYGRSRKTVFTLEDLGLSSVNEANRRFLSRSH